MKVKTANQIKNSIKINRVKIKTLEKKIKISLLEFKKLQKEFKKAKKGQNVKREDLKKTKLRENRFIDEYLLTLNGKQAAIKAGYSKKSAAPQASRLLTKPNVLKIINKRLKKSLEDNEQILTNKTINGLKKKAFANLGEYLDRNGNIDLRNKDIYPITAIERDRNNRFIKKIKMSSQEKALEILCKYLKLFEDSGNKQPTQININFNKSKK